jgi:hypothetical protein
MNWKEIDPERRQLLIKQLDQDGQTFLATAKGIHRPDGKEYFEQMGRAYSAAAEALKQLAEE